MKKSLLLLTAVTLTVLSCTKDSTTAEAVNTENNMIVDTVSVNDTLRATSETESGNAIADTHTYDYSAEDGTLAVVTFLNTSTENTLTVKMNDQTYILDQTEAWAKGADYEKNGVSAHSQRDNLEIKMDGKTVRLKRQYN